MKFKCKECGSTRFEEVLLHCTQLTEITGFENGVPVYGDHSIDDGEVDRYQCLECGSEILDNNGRRINTGEELFKLLGDK